jgi:ribosome-binding factor A
MSAYNPPIEQLPIFDTNAFTNANEGNGALVSEYLKFPIAQGVETFPSGLIGNLTGSLTSTTNTDLRISTTTGTNRINFNNTGTTGNICYMNSAGLTMATNKIITGNLTGSASKVVIGNKTDDVNYNLIFSNDYGSSQNLYMDGGFNLQYNPSTDTITTSNLYISNIKNNDELSFELVNVGESFRFLIAGNEKLNINNTLISTSTNMYVEGNLQNSFLSAIVGNGAFFIDGDTDGGDIVITAKTSTSKTIIQTEGVGGVLTTCATFENGGITGNLNGNASSVTITSDNGNGNYFIPFTKTSGTGSRTLFMDDTLPALTYSPNNNLLTVRNIEGTTLTASNDFDMTIATATGTKKIYFNNTGTTGNICYMDSGGIQMAIGKYLTGYVIGDVTGVCSKLLLTSSSSNIEYNVPFTSGVGGGSGGDFYIDSSFNIKYNPSTNNLTVPNMIVSNNLQNSYLSAIVGGGAFYIDGDTAGGDIVITAKTSGSKTIIQTEGVGGVLTNCAIFENGGITGNLNGTSSAITMTSDNSNVTCYIPFTKVLGTGSKTLFIDDVTGPLTYNPSTGLLTTTVSSVNVTAGASTGNYYLTMVSGNTSGSKTLVIDSTTNQDLIYNNNTNVLTARNLIANTLYSISTVDLNIATTNIGNSIRFNGTTSTNNICYMDSTGLTMATGKIITGDLTGVASKSKVISNIDDVYYDVPFANWDNINNVADWYRSGVFFKFQYNPTKSKLNIRHINMETLYNETAIFFNVGLDGSGNEIKRLTINSNGASLSNGGQFYGNLDGSAKKVDLIDSNDDITCYPVFSKTNTIVTNNELFVDGVITPFTYNPFTSTLTCSNFSGTVSKVSVTRDNADVTCFPVFAKNTGSGSKTLFFDDVDNNFTYNPSTSTLTATFFDGTSSNITTTITSSNFTYNIPFTNNDATGSSSLYIDTGLNLNYNPSTDTLSVPSINAGLLKNSGDITLQTGTNTDLINFNVATTRYMSISPTEIKARSGAKFVGDLTGQINDLLGADTYTSNVTLSAPNYSRISYFVGTSNFDIILSNSPTPPNGSAFYIVFKIPDTGTLYSLTVYDGSVSSTTKVNKFIGQNGDKIGGKFLYYTGVGWFSLSGSF